MIQRFAALLGLAAVLLVTAEGASAQAAPTLPGITISGTASAAATADSAQLVLRVASKTSGTMLSPADLKALSDTLVGAGVDPATLTDPFPANGPWSYASISGSLSHPGARTLQSAVDQISAAVKTMPNVLVQQLFVTLTVSDCRPIASQARRLALAQTRSQAADLAIQGGVHLGRPVAITVGPTTMGAAPNKTPNGCTSTYIMGGGNPPFSNIPQMFQVRVFATLTATYAIL